jgi:hypothetical protein
MGTDRQRKIFVRPAQLGDRLVTAQFVDHRGFADARDPDIEVCVPAGAELAFDLYLECEPRGPQRSLTGGYLKARLRESSDLPDDIEGWLTAPTEQGTDSARWLDFVDSILEMAVQRRQCIRELVKRFGRDIDTRAV